MIFTMDLYKSASSVPGIGDIKSHSEDVESLKMMIINYLHQVSHFLNTFLEKNFFSKTYHNYLSQNPVFWS